VIVDNPLAEAFPGRFAGIFSAQHIEQPFHRSLGRSLVHRLPPAFAFQPHRFFGEIAGDLLHIPADIADFGKLGRFDLDERGIGQLRQTA